MDKSILVSSNKNLICKECSPEYTDRVICFRCGEKLIDIWNNPQKICPIGKFKENEIAQEIQKPPELIPQLIDFEILIENLNICKVCDQRDRENCLEVEGCCNHSCYQRAITTCPKSKFVL